MLNLSMILVKDMDPKTAKGGPEARTFIFCACRAPSNAHPTRNQLSNFAALGMDVDIQDAQPDPRSQRSSRQRSSGSPRDQRSSQPGPHSQRSSDMA